MGCFPWAGRSSDEKPHRKRRNKRNEGDDDVRPTISPVSGQRKLVEDDETATSQSSFFDIDVKQFNEIPSPCLSPSGNDDTNSSKTKKFTLAEMVVATDDFRDDYFLGEGGFGKVYKGIFHDSNEIVAIKQLDRNGCQGMKELIVEVSTLGNAEHPNLVKLIGYCIEEDQSLLVYEYMPLGSLDDHLHGSVLKRKALDWNTRIKIVAGAARGLEYLHNQMNPPVIYRDLKCSNILLGDDYHPKLSDFGLAKEGPSGDRTHVSTRVMGTYGYCAPDYAMTGQLNFKSDIYSFGVVLLEIITGRKAIDQTRERHEQNLVEWAKPMFKDRKNFPKMVDPTLDGQYPIRGLYQVLAIAAMCVQAQPSLRPLVSDVVNALNFLASQKYDPNLQRVQAPKVCV